MNPSNRTALSSPLWRAALDIAPAEMVLVDDRGVIVFANQAWLRFGAARGAEPAAIGVGVDYFAVCARAAGAAAGPAGQAAQVLRAVLHRGAARQVLTYACPGPDLSRWFQMDIAALPHGHPRYALITHTDVTEQHLPLRALINEEDRDAITAVLKAELDNNIVILDEKARIRWVNSRFTQVTGYALPEIEGRVPMSFLSGPKTDLTQRAFMLDRLERGEGFNREVRFHRKDGRPFWVHLRMSPVRNARGELVRFVAVGRDITERRDAQEALHQAKEAAEAADRAKTAFLGNISHELRTPMNAVLGFAGLLHDTPLSEDQRSFVRMIQGSGEQLLHIINDILDITQTESGTLVLEEQPCELTRVVEEGFDMVRLRAAERGLALRLQFEGDRPGWVLTDPARLRQVLLNLLGNAIKFTAQGAITVTLRGDRAQGRFLLRVQDSGAGIAAEHLDGLFTRFHQGDSSLTRRHGGAGLGLAISRQLVELMGGAIGVDSEVGRGSTFWFWLPWRPAPSPSRPPAPDAATAPRLPLQVLVVDDNPANQLLAKRMLEKMGGLVTLADNGREAVALCEQRLFDLIFMDCQMPEMDGFEATGRIKAMPARAKGRQGPIIALTASTLPSERGTCIAAGMDDFLSKPLRPQALREVLTRWVSLPLRPPG